MSIINDNKLFMYVHNWKHRICEGRIILWFMCNNASIFDLQEKVSGLKVEWARSRRYGLMRIIYVYTVNSC